MSMYYCEDCNRMVDSDFELICYVGTKQICETCHIQTMEKEEENGNTK